MRPVFARLLLCGALCSVLTACAHTYAPAERPGYADDLAACRSSAHLDFGEHMTAMLGPVLAPAVNPDSRANKSFRDLVDACMAEKGYRVAG